ncbi:MAG: TonB-dependent receptor [Rhodothermaceae bacterium]|nr:TonB-dependent receptor [Rhodothermaceae bacterium]MXZ58394.1 TonB-dependent receptor [Rhodothermaceae bacterium]MYB90143.1 TonB-dependent receptor [Rhodothermaceae bacterium]MYD67139.1 TonB-dependent receptor [Rhodothermaceae bacterium]MYG44982.1 TonB-dependent receptor [Rhodothermaceae bacterium]
MKSIYSILFSFLIVGSVNAQSTISGVVTDAESGLPLPGATVVVAGTVTGTATDSDGAYVISDLSPGTYAIEVSFVGYEAILQSITLQGSNVTFDFALQASSQALEALELFASRALNRQTPVAYSDIEKLQVQRELGSRDVPLVLNTTPSVYSTAQGGGAGDARVNVRGFNQRNVAVMINGVPVNDMENGWVYWSNWDGVGDATTSIQLQRGLSAVNLATPSIGGTLNILTDPAANRRRVMAKQEFGNDGFLKSTVSASTGLIDNRFAFTVSGVRKTGNGYYDGTWTDAWAYYVAGAWNINERHRVDFYAVGAPQRHGQNLYRQNIAAYDHDYAREVFEADGLDESTISEILSTYPEGGRRWNQNVSPVSSSYTNEQHNGFGTVRRNSRDIINERENFFHKPQVNLNYFAQLSDRSLWSTVLYYSGGKGGGTGTHGRMQWNFSGPSRVVDYNATISANQENGQSRGILRNSHNVQWTVGAISKFKHELTEALTLEAGIDWRTASIDHYRTVRDLLGGSGYQRFDSDFWGENGKLLQLGDRFNYNTTNTVDWLGGFVQGAYTSGGIYVYGMAGYSTIKYSHEDHFRDAGNGTTFTIATDRIGGYQIKGGASYLVNDMISVFVNAGLVSKVPILDGALNDITGVLNPDPQNEQFRALETGISFESLDRTLNTTLSLYNTVWNDRTITRSVLVEDGDDGLINILGLNALHRGIEAEVAYQPLRIVRADLALSVGNWKYTDDVSARYTPDRSDPSTQETVSLYVKDVKVGDAPQTQIAYAISVFPVKGMYAKFTGRSYTDYYADFDPTSRTDSGQSGQPVWKVPGYNVFDINLGYTIPRRFGSGQIRVFANVFNLFDSLYIQDATNNSRFNAFRGNGTGANRADDAEVFLGLPRSFNLGLQVTLQ